MNLKSIADIENEIANTQTELDQTTHEIGRSILINKIADLEIEKKNALEAQERATTQEAEVDSITLPYDFDELLSEEGHPITGANDMIIEVVKDTKRQANIEKNQALDEQKAGYDKMLFALKADYEEIEAQRNILLSQNETMEKRAHQTVLERDDAFTKRDAAFRQLQEAQEEIAILKIKLENVPQAKSSLDISPSDKLAKMVKESLEAKVNRGLARWDIPVLEPVHEPIELGEIAEPGPIENNETTESTELGLVDQSLSLSGEKTDEVVTLESLHARVSWLERAVYGKPQEAVV